MPQQSTFVSCQNINSSKPPLSLFLPFAPHHRQNPGLWHLRWGQHRHYLIGQNRALPSRVH